MVDCIKCANSGEWQAMHSGPNSMGALCSMEACADIHLDVQFSRSDSSKDGAVWLRIVATTEISDAVHCISGSIKRDCMGEGRTVDWPGTGSSVGASHVSRPTSCAHRQRRSHSRAHQGLCRWKQNHVRLPPLSLAKRKGSLRLITYCAMKQFQTAGSILLFPTYSLARCTSEVHMCCTTLHGGSRRS